jgi:hypothetical protein
VWEINDSSTESKVQTPKPKLAAGAKPALKAKLASVVKPKKRKRPDDLPDGWR